MSRYTASDLRHRIEILGAAEAPDGAGGKSQSYVSFSPQFILRAKVTPRSASEQFTAGQMASSERLLVVIRYRQGLDQTIRLACGSRQFEVTGIVDVEQRHQWLEIECEERFGE